mgnify:FL=1
MHIVWFCVVGDAAKLFEGLAVCPSQLLGTFVEVSHLDWVLIAGAGLSSTAAALVHGLRVIDKFLFVFLWHCSGGLPRTALPLAQRLNVYCLLHDI